VKQSEAKQKVTHKTIRTLQK